MKRILFVVLIVGCFVTKGQNYIITMYDTVKYGNCGDLLLPTVTFSSTTGSPVQMHFKRILKNIPTGWTSCFCAPSCIPQTQDTMNFTIPAVGDKNHPPYQNVTPNFGTDSISGVGEVIVVFNEIGVNHYDTIYFRGFTSCLAGIKEISGNEFGLRAYPNPTSKSITVSYELQNPAKAEIFNVTGQKMKELMISPVLLGKKEIKIDLENLKDGVYYLKFTSEGRHQTIKFCVSN
jgi:hypothetical protein